MHVHPANDLFANFARIDRAVSMVVYKQLINVHIRND